MDIITTASKIGERLLPFFLKSKTITQIGKEIGEATDTELSLLWKKVKPWFIEEYEEEKPLDDTFEKEDVKGVVKKGLKNTDDDTKNAIDELLKKLEERQPVTKNTATVKGNNNIVNQGISNSDIQIHTGTGDNIKGDKKVYNIDKIDKADFS
jgi:hypothetical protein